MKYLKIFTFVFLFAFLTVTSESYAFPRHKVYKVVYRVRPVCYPVRVTTYYVVKKPKIYYRHHKKVIRKVIYY